MLQILYLFKVLQRHGPIIFAATTSRRTRPVAALPRRTLHPHGALDLNHCHGIHLRSYIISYHITFYYIILHYVTLYYIILHCMSCDLAFYLILRIFFYTSFGIRYSSRVISGSSPRRRASAAPLETLTQDTKLPGTASRHPAQLERSLKID